MAGWFVSELSMFLGLLSLVLDCRKQKGAYSRSYKGLRLFLNRLESISRRRKFEEAAGKPIMYWSEDYVSKQSRNGRTAWLTGSSSIGSSRTVGSPVMRY
ncbi:hypothetical protein HZH66_012088 [Vespula vulgaris]|uniref:Uncharacterized protein n=1 Tax=Vespula vulgaris TaxID=7454 RepID=A0A834JD77_VESVU|nr:hypothetical protein HZH66_012088 [Vespula vulgaris]